MADCYLRTFDPNGDPTYKLSKSDRLIMLRSGKTHSEFQFSHRYKGISASATMADKCRCFRFKMIGYSKHPKRWKTQVIKLTGAQEDAIMLHALAMAGLVKKIQFEKYPKLSGLTLWSYAEKFKKSNWGDMFFIKKYALKYDLIGVSFSFVLPKWRIWRPHKRWVFCSEACCLLIQVAYPDFNDRADELTPEGLEFE